MRYDGHGKNNGRKGNGEREKIFQVFVFSHYGIKSW